VADSKNNRIQKFYSNGTFVKKWGSEGTGDGEFQRIHDLDFDPLEKRLYVSDRDGNRIQVFDKNGTFLFKWGSKGTANGQFTIPYSVDVDSQDNVWVTDRGNHRIQKFDKDGNFLFKFGNPDTHPSSATGKFDNPRQAAVDKDVKFIYVADSKNNRIQKFYSNGTFVKKWGKFGSHIGEFHNPEGIAIDSKFFVYVTDKLNNRVQKFSPDGTFIRQWGKSGSGIGEFQGPKGIAIESGDFILVADWFNHRIQKFTNSGDFIREWGGVDTSGLDLTKFVQGPEVIAIDSNDNNYVTNKMAGFQMDIK